MIFFGATSVNLTKTEQLIGTIVRTGPLKIPHEKFAVSNTEQGIIV